MGDFDNILVLIPSYGPMEHATQCVVRDLVCMGAMMIEAHGQGLIDRVRSDLASRALLGEQTEWLWLDSDTACQAEDLRRLLHSRRRHDAGIMMAPYVTKERPAVPALVFDHGHALWPTKDRNRVLFGRDGYVYPARRVGFGATVTHRRVFELVASDMPKVSLQLSGENGYPFFAPRVEEETHSYVGEDYSFCDRAIEKGATVLCDTRIPVGHVGKYTYRVDDFAPRTTTATVDLGFGE